LDEAKIRYMLGRDVNVVPTTSVGRLFDAVACITQAWLGRTVLRAGSNAARK
jgi:hydrogenase maturation factor HypF (carbamoyltransferase family)